MKLKWIVFLAIIVVVMLFVILPTYVPNFTTRSVLHDSQVMAGDTFVLMNQSELAITMYDRVLAENATDAGVLKKKGEALIKCGRASEAGQIYQQVLTDNRNDTAVLIRVGDTFCQQGNYQGALAYYDQALTINPGDSKVWMRKGDTLMLITADETNKLRDIAKNMGKQPGTPGYQDNSANQAQSMDSYQKAMESYNKAMEIDPKLSVAVSTRVLAATQNQISTYQNLLGDVQSS